MIRICLPWPENHIAEALQPYAELWQFDVRTTAEGYWLLPEYMYAKHGIQVEREDSHWCFFREADATTWEDFLLMHLTHHLAAERGLQLEYRSASRTRFLSASPESFATFESYVNKVLEKDAGLVRDMKRNWLYAHRTRYNR
ncbi:hypothetical protein B5M42_011270 [Paenibacillus athensensis]|uniref:Uncharacterized protein n=1 Tax=Paenibacillus athensensis TaxID=1967502 RepID=A0A4Y8PVW7_9BACL|nr:hypothetical protein [Paenibacillus athensensis]MCD1259414.1 hypothetical protein [Paenibacillus athensensis]